MTNTTIKLDDKKPTITKKPSSPFVNDPYNNRGGGGNKKSGFVDNKGHKMKSIRTSKFKSGGGGDR
jgi:hypothetical protein